MSVSETAPLPPVELKNPVVAGLLAWLWPGAGHLYQGRYLKAGIYMGCVLSLFICGLWLGEGKVVYASAPGDAQPVLLRGKAGRLLHRWPFAIQAAVGLPASPAVMQVLFASPQKPILGGLMASPENEAQLSDWYKEIHYHYDIGWFYTITAGVLNIFAIFDAACGPAGPPPGSKPKDDKEKEKDKEPAKS